MISAIIAVRLTFTFVNEAPLWYFDWLRFVPGAAKSAAAKVASRVKV
jgi:undecaprenyl pyrophosphate phosphatase UppP